MSNFDVDELQQQKTTSGSSPLSQVQESEATSGTKSEQMIKFS